MQSMTRLNSWHEGGSPLSPATGVGVAPPPTGVQLLMASYAVVQLEATDSRAAATPAACL